MAIYLICCGSVVYSDQLVSIHVQVIHASNEKDYIDSRISGSINDFQSVFRYSAYTLLNEKIVKIGMRETGSISLTGNRLMQITPQNIIGGQRVKLTLQISENGKSIFNTTVQLQKKRSMIVGGPKHHNGVLLFTIMSDF